MPSSSLPKLSYVLLSHNREKYIRGAIESAFAQDYEGELEYIFSDDCSTDRTFEIIKECVAAYKGNRIVKVLQTPHNMKLAKHTDFAFSYATGEWFIRADDDDLSHCSRCRIIADAITRHTGVTFVATSYQNFTQQNEKSAYSDSYKPILQIEHEFSADITNKDLPNPSFSFDFYFKAWHSSIRTVFGNLPKSADYVDDLIYYHRACVLGKGLYVVSNPLVFARIDSGNQSTGEKSTSDSMFNQIRNYELFLDKYHNTSYEPMLALSVELSQYIKENYSTHQRQAASAFLQGLDTSLNNYELQRHYWRRGIVYRLKVRKIRGEKSIFSLIRCLPLHIFAFLMSVIKRCKSLFK